MISRALILVVLLGGSAGAWAHKGKLDKYGCHKSKKEHYHCHQGVVAGMQFRDQYEMLKEKHARERASSTGPR
jgi:uncharacterized membrane protein YsdA (DUF1294 family)